MCTQRWHEGSAGNKAEHQSHWLEWSLGDCPTENAITYSLCADVLRSKSKPSNRKGERDGGKAEGKRKRKTEKKKKRKKGTEGGKED